MKLSNQQKRAIRTQYPNLTLRFRPDGTVEAKKGKGTSFGVLYTPKELAAYIHTFNK